MLEPLVLHESDRVLALVKPFGMPSQPDPSGDRSLLEWAGAYLGREVHLLHRLDRPTGGLVLVAKSAPAAADLSRQFQERTVTKSYLAVVEGECPRDELELEHYLGKLPGKNFVRAYDKPVRGSKPARMRASVAARAEGLTLLRIELFTGRRHQIRAQLQRLKLSILGDHKYGRTSRDASFPGIALWSYMLGFTEPDGRRVELRAEPPRLSPWDLFSEIEDCP